MNSWTNEAGEPIMSGEAWRTEQALDAAEPPYNPDDYLAHDDDEEEDDEDDEGHSDGDGCAIYDPGYRVILRDSDDEDPDGDGEDDDPRTSVEDLEPGDIYRDPAVDGPGEWFEVNEVARVDDDIHIDSAREDSGSDDAKRQTRVVPDVGSPGKWVAQYYDPDMELWFDIGDPRETEDEARAHLAEEEGA